LRIQSQLSQRVDDGAGSVFSLVYGVRTLPMTR
jgi:hypothetical protein